MRFLLLILLAFPVLEIWLLVELGHLYGWWVWAYVILMAVLGWRLIQDEKLLIAGRVMQTLSQGGTPAKAMFGSAKNMIAGVLLIIPGVITDVFAVILLLTPSVTAQSGIPRSRTTEPANSDVIEGEYRRED